MKRMAWGMALALMVARSAQAEPANGDIVQEGIDLRRAGRDAEALAVFERALALDGSSRTRAQVALAEQALGLWVEAERDLLAALSAGDDAWFLQHRRALQSALDTIRSRLATVLVEANVTGAELWINGSAAGHLPLSAPIRVVAGVVTFEVRAPGYESQARTLAIAAQTRVRERFELTESPSGERGAKGGAPMSTTGRLGAVVALPSPPPLSRPTASSRSDALRTAAWASAASTVALLAAAGISTLEYDSNAAVYNDDSRCYYGGLTRDQRCEGYRRAATLARTLAVTAFVASAATTGLSVVLFTWASQGPRPVTLGALRCVVGTGVSCGASF